MSIEDLLTEGSSAVIPSIRHSVVIPSIRNGNGTIDMPRITGFGVIHESGEDNAPLDLRLPKSSGSMNLVINKEAFVAQVFNKLEIKGGEHKGKQLSPELITEEIKRGKALLLKKNLFDEDGNVGEEYKKYQLTVSKMFTVADEKRASLKAPVNEISKAFQSLLSETLGELIEIRAEVMSRTKNYKIELETIKREAAAKDNLLREKTADEIQRLAFLPGEYQKKSSGEIEELITKLVGSNFTPHQDQAERYTEVMEKTIHILGETRDSQAAAEKEAVLKKEEDDKKAAAEQAELEELRAGKAEQNRKDAAAQHLANVNHYFSECVGKSSKLIGDAIESAEHEEKEAGDNEHFDATAVIDIIDKMYVLLKEANQKEADAKAAAKEAADRVAKEAADKKAQEDREKADAAAALEKENQELLINAGFAFGGAGYTKSGFVIQRSTAETLETEKLSVSINEIDKKIVANKAAAEKEEAEKKAKEEAKKKKDAAEKEAARKSYALKVKEMTAGIEACDDHEAIVKAILEDSIPHVRFMAD